MERILCASALKGQVKAAQRGEGELFSSGQSIMHLYLITSPENTAYNIIFYVTGEIFKPPTQILLSFSLNG